MYLGRIVELGPVGEVFDHPEHPYSQSLLSAIPIPDPVKERKRSRILLEGDLPSPANPPSGCPFHTRCPKFKTLDEADQARCTGETPLLASADGREDRAVACHFPEVVEVF
ncbi:MAG: hypothetical protein L0L02_06550 [Corynebacterium variabile]|nr:hypothetical protein [Corynebacterium variabile]